MSKTSRFAKVHQFERKIIIPQTFYIKTCRKSLEIRTSQIKIRSSNRSITGKFCIKCPGAEILKSGFIVKVNEGFKEFIIYPHKMDNDQIPETREAYYLCLHRVYNHYKRQARQLKEMYRKAIKRSVSKHRDNSLILDLI